jgi:uncharacterized protein (DUF342 family)
MNVETRPYRLKMASDGVYLLIEPSAEVALADVIAFIRSREIEEYDGDAILRAVNEKSGEPVRIADRRPELDKAAQVGVRISEDALTAEIRILPPLGKPWPTVEELKATLKEYGVVHGIREDVLQRLVSSRIDGKWTEVATGTAPVEGKDAEFVYKVELHGAKPKEIDDNRVDMKELGTVVNVVKGQELLEKIPPVPQKDGQSVLGKLIKARQVKDKNIPSGTNTYLSEDGLHLFAGIDGHVTIRDNKFTVLPVFEVHGDVDYSTGNIQFVGDVHVKGTVREGFEVTAGGNIVVGGVVEGAFLTAEGNITIRGGVRGMNRGKIQAKGNIEAGYIDQSWIRSAQDISVNEAIMHSDVGARGVVDVMGGKKGLIVGGKIQAGQEVRCEILGSEMGTRTEVVVGLPPEMLEERTLLQGSVKELDAKLQEILSNVSYLKKVESLGKLDDAKRQILLKLTRAQFQLQAQFKIAKEKLAALESQMDKTKAEGRVLVHKIVYPGVSVTIRGLTYLVRETMQFIAFSFIDGEVKARPYN